MAAKSEGPNAALLQPQNLLRNPGFEGNFFPWGGINEIQVAHEWTPFWHEDPDHAPAYHRPEYKRAVAAQFPNRVLGGESAQQWFTFHSSHLAGMYQQVFNVTPGQNYRFTIWAQVWSSTESNPHTSVLPANPRLRVGIDPTGEWNPWAQSVIWSPEAPMNSHIDQWGEISIEGVAQNSVITVFMRTNPTFANKHNDTYWDNASLIAVGAAQPTAVPPTSTSLPPPPATETPVVTNTPVVIATHTPLPTDTPPPPTETATAIPATDTPAPTSTATAVATETPLPTATETVPAPAATEVAAIQPTTAAEPTVAVEPTTVVEPTAPPMLESPTAVSGTPTTTAVNPIPILIILAVLLSAIVGGVLLWNRMAG